MVILNVTKDTILADRVTFAETLWQRMIGLIGRKDLGEEEGLIIKPCSSIHTFFMRFPIDVVFLNKDLKVIKVKEQMQPFRLTLSNLFSRCVIELAHGTIARSHTKIGDAIETRE